VLAERGARVLVLEARPGLGGRAGAFTDPMTRERVDNGQHVLFGCYHETFRFLRRIGTEWNVDVQKDLSIHVIDKRGRPPASVPLLPRSAEPARRRGSVEGARLARSATRCSTCERHWHSPSDALACRRTRWRRCGSGSNGTLRPSIDRAVVGTAGAGGDESID
jgi:phytoene dehydrogenase-like protein